MSQNKDREPQALRWLAETHHNDYIAVEGAPSELPETSGPPPLSLSLPYIGSKEFPLAYEPRCLAVSADGSRVALGTKGGVLHLATWGPVRGGKNGWTSENIEEALWEPAEPGGPSRWAIRAVAFLEASAERTVVALGWGDSRVSIVTFAPYQDPKVERDEKGKAAQGPVDATRRKRERMRRFSRLINLRPPDSLHAPLAPGILLLGLTRHGGAPSLLVRNAEGKYEVRVPTLTEGAAGVATRGAELTSLPDWKHIVDGVWQHGYLWLLTSAGQVLRCSPRGGGADSIPLRLDERYTVPEPPAQASYRAIDGCVMGLSVLASNSVTLLRFKRELGEGGSRETAVDTGGVRWFQVPDALECAVHWPKGGRAAPDTCEQLVLSNNPVWTAVSSAEPGLTWVAWSDAKAPDYQSGAQRDAPARKPAPWAAPGRFTGSGGSVIYLRFAWLGDPGGDGGRGAGVMAWGTRDHKLRIASVLDRYACDALIEAEVSRTEGIWKLGEPERGDASPPSPAMQWWWIRKELERDFSLQPASTPLPHWLDSLECTREDNLRRLAALVVRRWKDERLKSPDARLQLDTLLKSWTLRLLRRAYEIRASLPREVAREVHDRLFAARRHSTEDGDLRAKEEVDAADEQVGLFAIFLRKWFIRGYTYAEKHYRLWDLYKANLRCGRTLDSLAYLAKLMRNRVDEQWEAEPVPEGGTAPALDLVVAEGGAFSVQSYADGSICGVARDGAVMRWTLADGAALPPTLQLRGRGRVLRHARATDFIKQYRHGPLARRVLLIQHPAEENRYLLIFALKGWREPVSEDQRPLLCALIIAPNIAADADPSGSPPSDVRGGESPKSVLQIHDAVSLPVHGDLYGLCKLADRRAAQRWEVEVLAGTNGAWRFKDESGAGLREPTDLPFVEVRVSGDERCHLHLEMPSIKVKSSQRGRRSAVSLAEHNPCWSVVSAADPGFDAAAVWAGFKDGHIRHYRRDTTPDTWIEATHACEPGGSATESGFKTSAAVWRLCAITVDERESSTARRILAYGTADGTLGAVNVDLPFGPSAFPRQWAVPISTPPPPNAPQNSRRQAGSVSIHPIFHSRESAPISGLFSYRDFGDRGGTTARWRLLASTQSGVLLIFDLDYASFSAALSRAATGDPERPSRPSFPGRRLDRFRLAHPVGAAALASVVVPEEPPKVLVSSDRGKVHEYELRFPKGSARRLGAAERFAELRSPEELTDSVGGSQVHEWLRVLDVGDETLLRFSMWAQLEAQSDAIAADVGPSSPDAVTTFIRALQALSEEIYRRRPFSKEPVKILWQEGAKLANRFAERATETPHLRAEHIHSCYRLKLNVDDLCNRWIGFEQSLEAKVLTHSFNEMFHWTDILVIAGALDDERSAGEPLLHMREFLLHTVIRRRLMYADSIVPLETLRTINMAVRHALARDGVENPRYGRWRFRPTFGPDSASPCFLTLMRMVGDLERIHDSLAATDPLSTEVNTFMALCLLLIPESAFLVVQLVSESNLVAAGPGRAHLICARASVLRDELHLKRPAITPALDRFKDGFDEANLEVLAYDKAKPPRNAWERLIQYAPEAGPATLPFSDGNFATEQQHILRAASWLSRLDPPSEDFWSWDRDFSTLEDCRYFQHSYLYLTHLHQVRTEVVEELAHNGYPMKRCEKALRELGEWDLFEPQRGHYRQIILHWREQIYDRGRKAADALGIFDEFNRHVYRTSADSLMTSVIELCMQAAPLSFADPETRAKLHTTMLHRVVASGLDEMSLTRELLERADRLVDNTHTAAALISVARDYLGDSASSEQRGIPVVSPSDVTEVLFEAATRVLGMKKPAWRGTVLASAVPGTRTLWGFIAHEMATNIYRRSRQDSPAPPEMGFWHTPYLDGSARVRMGATSGSFWESLSPQVQKSLGTAIDQAAVVERLEELLPSLFEPRFKLHTDRFGSTGMGLTVIRKLAELAGMEADLMLWRPDHLDQRPRRMPPEARLGSPLWLEIRWSQPASATRTAPKDSVQ